MFAIFLLSLCVEITPNTIWSASLLKKERNNIQHIFMFLSQTVALNLLFLCQAMFHVSLFACWSSCLPFIAVFVVICLGIIHCILKLAVFSTIIVDSWRFFYKVGNIYPKKIQMRIFYIYKSEWLHGSWISLNTNSILQFSFFNEP